MFGIDVISRIVHIATAITLVGGSVFMLLILLPAVKSISEEAHRALAAAISTRWKRFVHVGILLFLVSGFYNYYVQAIGPHKGDGPYHALIGSKMLLALAVFAIASGLVGRSAAFEFMRKERRKWLAILVLLAATIVGISGFAKVRGVPSKSANVPAQQAETQQAETL